MGAGPGTMYSNDNYSSFYLRRSHADAGAEGALATVNTEAGLDYWLLWDLHKWGLALWKSGGASGRCPFYHRSFKYHGKIRCFVTREFYVPFVNVISSYCVNNQNNSKIK